jgi:hypothetical protein
MSIVFVNPGSGPCADYGRSDKRWAASNMRAFIRDVGGEGLSFAYQSPPADGRFTFSLSRGPHTVQVEIPGLALARVRYMGTEGQNIWHFPRLYIDGDSWVWLYAINAARRALGLEQDT